jgi:hypothetical protein
MAFVSFVEGFVGIWCHSVSGFFCPWFSSALFGEGLMTDNQGENVVGGGKTPAGAIQIKPVGCTEVDKVGKGSAGCLGGQGADIRVRDCKLQEAHISPHSRNDEDASEQRD